MLGFLEKEEERKGKERNVWKKISLEASLIYTEG